MSAYTFQRLLFNDICVIFDFMFLVVDLVGGLGNSLTSTLSAADLGLSSAAVSNSFGSLNSTGAGSGGGYLSGSNSFAYCSGIHYEYSSDFTILTNDLEISGGLSGRDFDSLSAVISNSVSKFDYGGGSGIDIFYYR